MAANKSDGALWQFAFHELENDKERVKEAAKLTECDMHDKSVSLPSVKEF